MVEESQKTQALIETEVLNTLAKLKNVGDSYSDVIRNILLANKAHTKFLEKKKLGAEFDKFFATFKEDAKSDSHENTR